MLRYGYRHQPKQIGVRLSGRVNPSPDESRICAATYQHYAVRSYASIQPVHCAGEALFARVSVTQG